MGKTNYFDKKLELTKKAVAHTEEMERDYAVEIETAVRSSAIYRNTVTYTPHDVQNPPSVVFLNTDSVSAIFSQKSGKTAVLNFASFKNPGGMFLEGSSAQEEALCHESFLYNVLREFDDTYYTKNRKWTNRSLYTNAAIYTPQVVFMRNGKKKTCDVITCAAPNFKAARKWQYVTEDENRNVFASRIEFLKGIAEANKVSTLILGAWGCGVFGQDPRETKALFEEAFRETTIKKIVYAVPGASENTQAFLQ